MFLVCGEALFDVFIDGDSEKSDRLQLDARPGGSPFNVAVGISRLGGKAALLTGIAKSAMGESLIHTLEHEKVATNYLQRIGTRTTMSFVEVDEHGQPSYEFYGLPAVDSAVTIDRLPSIGPEVVGLHFGSYSLVLQPVADAFAHLASNIKDRFISIDPNVRLSVAPDLDVWRSRVTEYAKAAHLVKLSMEDMQTLYPNTPASIVAEMFLESGALLVVITDGSNSVSAWTRHEKAMRISPATASVVDTVGAGDSFQAALLTRISELSDGDPKQAVETMDGDTLKHLLTFATKAARVTCGRRGADLPRRTELP